MNRQGIELDAVRLLVVAALGCGGASTTAVEPGEIAVGLSEIR